MSISNIKECEYNFQSLLMNILFMLIVSNLDSGHSVFKISKQLAEEQGQIPLVLDLKLFKLDLSCYIHNIHFFTEPGQNLLTILTSPDNRL